jgi:hypothetical protein
MRRNIRGQEMGTWRELEDFESRFEAMSASELLRWKDYFTQHAQLLQPKIRKEAMKRVYRIVKAIHQRSKDVDEQ